MSGPRIIAVWVGLWLVGWALIWLAASAAIAGLRAIARALGLL